MDRQEKKERKKKKGKRERKIKEKKGKEKKKRIGQCMKWKREKKKRDDTSLRDLLLIDSRNASGQETKLVHAKRATRGYQKLWVSSLSKR